MTVSRSRAAAGPRRFADRAKRHDWFAVAIDFLIVVFGIFIGLQANIWVQSRQDRAIEQRYLERLLADADESAVALREAVELNGKRAAILASLDSALRNGTAVPDHAALSDVLCRWFVQPAVEVRRGTYDELVSSGRLSLIRDEALRSDLALQEGAHEEAQRLDILTPAILQAAAPLTNYRSWKILPPGTTGNGRGVDCDVELDGMRRDRDVPSVIAQLYRDQTTHRAFRQRELKAVDATRSRLRELLGPGG